AGLALVTFRRFERHHHDLQTFHSAGHFATISASLTVPAIAGPIKLKVGPLAEGKTISVGISVTSKADNSRSGGGFKTTVWRRCFSGSSGRFCQWRCNTDNR